MAATSTVHPHLLIDHFIGTAKGSSLRTVFLPALLLFFSYTVYVAGRALHLMHESGMMHTWEALWFQKDNTTLLMLVFHHARSSLFHTKLCAITLLSGAMQMSGNGFHIPCYWTHLNNVIQGLRTRKNYSIYAIHQHTMPLNVFLVSWNIDSEFCC